MPDRYGFDRETAVVPRPGDPSSYDAELHEGWRIGRGINGGLLLALAGRALAAELADGEAAHADPLAISGYYLSAARPGPVSVRTETLRRGRTVSTGTASVRQGSEERLRVLATFGDLRGQDHADVRTSATSPQLPPPGECAGPEAAPGGFSQAGAAAGPVRAAPGPGDGWLGGGGAFGAWPDPGLVQAAGRAAARPADAAARRGCAPARQSRPRHQQLGADAGTHRACTGLACAGLAAAEALNA